MTKKTLITSFNTKYNTAPFRIIQTEDFLPAFKETIKMAKKEIDTIVINPKKPSFENTIEALDFSGEQLDRISSIFFNLNSFTPNFKASRTNFNNTELTSLNAIFTLSEKVKLKTLGFFNWDENDFFRSSIQNFNINQAEFTNTEKFILRKKKLL